MSKGGNFPTFSEIPFLCFSVHIYNIVWKNVKQILKNIVWKINQSSKQSNAMQFKRKTENCKFGCKVVNCIDKGNFLCIPGICTPFPLKQDIWHVWLIFLIPNLSKNKGKNLKKKKDRERKITAYRKFASPRRKITEWIQILLTEKRKQARSS